MMAAPRETYPQTSRRVVEATTTRNTDITKIKVKVNVFIVVVTSLVIGTLTIFAVLISNTSRSNIQDDGIVDHENTGATSSLNQNGYHLVDIVEAFNRQFVIWGKGATSSLNQNGSDPIDIVEFVIVRRVGMTKDGWYRTGNSYEYKYFNSRETYNGATDACKSVDDSATLAAVGVRDQTFTNATLMRTLGLPATVNKVWVGATDILDIGSTWRFQDGVALPPSQISWGNFLDGPVEPTGDEHCMDYFVAGSPEIHIPGANDDDCMRSLSYICERPV